jgi:hypothetical protein
MADFLRTLHPKNLVSAMYHIGEIQSAPAIDGESFPPPCFYATKLDLHIYRPMISSQTKVHSKIILRQITPSRPYFSDLPPPPSIYSDAGTDTETVLAVFG